MSKKIATMLSIVFFSSLLVVAISTSISAESSLPVPPVSWPDVPATGPLTPEQINDLPPPSADTNALDEQFNAEISRIEVNAKAKGFSLVPLSGDKLAAGMTLREALTEAQRQAIGKAFARHENELKGLMTSVEAALKDKARPEAEMLETARGLEERLATWQANLDSDIGKVLTEEQMAQFRRSQPAGPKLDVTVSDLEALGLEVPEPNMEPENVGGGCTDCYYTYYYGYYTYLYMYYAYLYAYYGYYATGSSYAYYAYLYNYNGYYYAYYAYIYGYYAYYYCPNSSYSSNAYYCSNYAKTYSYYGYIYSYYAYYYSGNSYLYYAYLYAYYGYAYSSDAYNSASKCNSGQQAVTLNVPNYQQEQDQWCWDGVSQMIGDYFGAYVAQCTIANWAWSVGTCCTSPSSSTCNQPNSMWGTSGSLQAILSHFWGISSTTLSNYLSFSSVQSQINSGYPIIVRWGWTSGGGHFVIIRGYKQSGSYTYYADPWDGAYHTSTYSWIVNDGNHSWTDTLYNIHN